jgi:alkylhydroperoxidase family enzyme
MNPTSAERPGTHCGTDVSRIRYLTDDEAIPESRDALADVMEGRGYVSNVHRSLAHSPSALRAFENFSGHVNGSSRLDLRTRELIILRTALIVGNEYEWRRHVPKALDAGVAAEQLRTLSDWTSGEYSSAHRAVFQLIDEYMSTNAVSDETVANVRDSYGDELLIEILLTVGWYLLVSTLIIPLDVVADDPEPTDLAVPFRRTVHHA